MDSPPNKRPRQRLAPRRLAKKLLAIRKADGLSQAKMLCIINEFETAKNRARVHQYETGKRTPSLIETLNYAVYALISLEDLLNDEKDLPIRFCLTSDQNTHPCRPADSTKPLQISAQSIEAAAPVASNKRADAQGGDSNCDTEIDLPNLGEPSPAESADSVADSTESGNPAAVESVPDNFRLTDAYRMVFSEDMMEQCQKVYSALAAKVPFDKKWLLSTNKFLELLLAVALNDCQAHGNESAVAYRVRLLLEDQTDG